jgi:hypothetical protein
VKEDFGVFFHFSIVINMAKKRYVTKAMKDLESIEETIAAIKDPNAKIAVKEIQRIFLELLRADQ